MRMTCGTRGVAELLSAFFSQRCPSYHVLHAVQCQLWPSARCSSNSLVLCSELLRVPTDHKDSLVGLSCSPGINNTTPCSESKGNSSCTPKSIRINIRWKGKIEFQSWELPVSRKVREWYCFYNSSISLSFQYKTIGLQMLSRNTLQLFHSAFRQSIPQSFAHPLMELGW